MTAGAIEALRADREALLEIGRGLTAAKWAAESGCAGWSVQDVVAHMGALFWRVVDPSKTPDAGDVATEEAQEVYVASRRSWTAAEVLDDYEKVSADAIDRLAWLETQEELVLPLGDLGTYPGSLLPNAFSFDHYTHIRADLFAPRGPLQGTPPPSDDLRVRPALEWIVAALPQQNPSEFAELTGWIELALEGAAARTVYLGPKEIDDAPHGDVVATIECDSPAFVRWVTQRTSWDDAGVTASGDAQHLALARRLHVF